MAVQLDDDCHPPLARAAMARPLGQQQSLQRLCMGGKNQQRSSRAK
jgi:hypothetical protein